MNMMMTIVMPLMPDVVGVVATGSVSCCCYCRYRERELNSTALEANIQHLKPATRYRFKVIAHNAAGAGGQWAQITVETQSEGWCCLRRDGHVTRTSSNTFHNKT